MTFGSLSSGFYKGDLFLVQSSVNVVSKLKGAWSHCQNYTHTITYCKVSLGQITRNKRRDRMWNVWLPWGVLFNHDLTFSFRFTKPISGSHILFDIFWMNELNRYLWIFSSFVKHLDLGRILNLKTSGLFLTSSYCFQSTFLTDHSHSWRVLDKNGFFASSIF